ncbi:hypothetical protein SAY86_008415 [Trapa natans]|uniref:DUF632 domain-containing protein n=1 Tax=Trapa natans TaxID=22666 RepID=A0AAN7QAX0_TRANT|nr:hypothetical protein SAY86_008415 [Trapa natans]
MGCAQSKIDEEEAVIRCKERKQCIRHAIDYRNAFAAAHSVFAAALRNTGAALSDYAQGEVQNLHQIIPNLTGASPAAGQHHYEPIPPPPPLPSFISPSLSAPLQRASSAPEMKILKEEARRAEPTIQEADEENELEGETSGSLRQRSSKPRPQPQPPRKLSSQPQHTVPAPPFEIQPPVTPPQDNPIYDYIFAHLENIPGPSLSEAEEEAKVDEQHTEAKVLQKMPERVEVYADLAPPPAVEKVVEPPPQPPAAVPPVAVAGKSMRKGKVGSVETEGKRPSKNVSLFQLFKDLDYHFLKASDSAQEVSKMLEATRVHYHSNFADDRGHVDHSKRLLRVITWNRSLQGLKSAEDVHDDDFDSEENETHATVLDKLLAWEKKLYNEVKGGELLKIDYQKKVDMLNKRKQSGTNPDSLEKIKAAVSHLHTRYVVDMQSLDSTVSEINRLRDELLYQNLLQLIDGMARMWEIMKEHYYNQQRIVQDLRYINISQSPKETSQHHHNQTFQLFNVIGEWHSHFSALVDNQRKYVKALISWLKLSLVPIESSSDERVSSPARIQSPPIQRLLFAWQERLEKLPDQLARTAIRNFHAVMDTLVNLQAEEMKMRRNCEEARKDLARKERSLADLKKKLMERRTPRDDMEADDEHNKTKLVEKELMLETLKKRLEEEENACQRLCRQVREKSMMSFKNRMPELFVAMVSFATSSSDMYNDLMLLSQQPPKAAVNANGEKVPTTVE